MDWINLQLFGGRGGSSGIAAGGKLEPGFDREGNFSVDKYYKDIGVDPYLYTASEIDREVKGYGDVFSGKRISMGLQADEKLSPIGAAIREVAFREAMNKIEGSGVLYSDHGDVEMDYSKYSFAVTDAKSNGMGENFHVSVYKKGGKKPIHEFDATLRQDFSQVGSRDTGSISYNNYRKRVNTKWNKEPSEKYNRAVQEREKYEEYKRKHNR